MYSKNSAVRRRVESALRAAYIDSLPCGDNSCWFGSPGGMATNGGCRCFKGLGHDPIVVAMYKRLATAIKLLAQEVEEKATQ